MHKSHQPLAFLFLHIILTDATFGVGVGVGVGIGNGGGIWIGGGTNGQIPSGSSPSNPNKVYTALQVWKSSITDDPFGILTSWVGNNVCSYKGVFCSNPQGQNEKISSSEPLVAAIDLNHANLQGTLVKELSFLTDMSLLHLNSNRFSGSVPETFKDLFNLQELDLSNNQFSGSFPIVTLYIPNLIYLDLRYNKFSGPIPEDLFNNKFDAIFLNNNQFEGELPQSLGNSQASVINLANNKFSGNIPPSFGLMSSKLKEILFLNNQLTGCVPEGVGFFTDIQVFDLSFNSLMGHLPDTISCLEDVKVLNFAHNKFSGILPDLVCSLKSLLNLSVAYNYFSGFSQECNKLSGRNVGFDFSLNCIPGRGMQRSQPECSVIPGGGLGGLSCLRIPGAKPFVCGGSVVISSEKDKNLSSP